MGFFLQNREPAAVLHSVPRPRCMTGLAIASCAEGQTSVARSSGLRLDRPAYPSGSFNPSDALRSGHYGQPLQSVEFIPTPAIRPAESLHFHFRRGSKGGVRAMPEAAGKVRKMARRCGSVRVERVIKHRASGRGDRRIAGRFDSGLATSHDRVGQEGYIFCAIAH